MSDDAEGENGYPSPVTAIGILSETKIGSLNDTVSVPFQLGNNTLFALLNNNYYHVHGRQFVYPSHASSVTLTAGAGAWNLTGAIIEVIPANVLNYANFDLHWIDINSISANGEIQIDIFKGAAGNEIQIGATKANRNAVMSQEGSKRLQIPQQLLGERISCRLSDSTAGQITCTVSFNGHYYRE